VIADRLFKTLRHGYVKMVSFYFLLWFYFLTQSGRGESQDADCANHDCTWMGDRGFGLYSAGKPLFICSRKEKSR
jgi:hypothetical protein